MASWGRHDNADDATERILAAAGRVHRRKGVTATTMADVAAEAGCSRATLYLYFPSRTELRNTVRNRAAIDVATAIAAETADLQDPAVRMAESALRAIARVRASPELAVWFEPGAAGITHELATSSDVIAAIAIGSTSGAADAEQAAAVLVRVIVSYLISPDPDNERAGIELLVSAVFSRMRATSREEAT